MRDRITMQNSAMLLEPTLRKLVPHKVGTFAKLEQGEPYHFDRWGDDHTGTLCLYYSFPARNRERRNTKRIPSSEIDAALRCLCSNGGLRREEFRKVCPVAVSAGPCGFAVVGRIFEELGVAVYASRRDGFTLTDADKARKLLDPVQSLGACWAGG